MLRCSLQRRPSSGTAAAVCSTRVTAALRCAPLPHLHMHCSAFAPRKPCSNHRTSHPHCCARYRCPPWFQIAQREAVSRCISQAAARAGHAAARRHQKGCKRELDPRAAASGGNKKCKAAGRNSAASTRACSSKQNKESVWFMRDGAASTAAGAAKRQRPCARVTTHARQFTCGGAPRAKLQIKFCAALQCHGASGRQ